MATSNSPPLPQVSLRKTCDNRNTKGGDQLSLIEVKF